VANGVVPLDFSLWRSTALRDRIALLPASVDTVWVNEGGDVRLSPPPGQRASGAAEAAVIVIDDDDDDEPAAGGAASRGGTAFAGAATLDSIMPSAAAAPCDTGGSSGTGGSTGADGFDGVGGSSGAGGCSDAGGPSSFPDASSAAVSDASAVGASAAVSCAPMALPVDTAVRSVWTDHLTGRTSTFDGVVINHRLQMRGSSVAVFDIEHQVRHGQQPHLPLSWPRGWRVAAALADIGARPVRPNPTLSVFSVRSRRHVLMVRRHHGPPFR
jgi:hypothetical protein